MDFNKVSKHDIEILKYELRRDSNELKSQISRDLSDQTFYQYLIGLILFVLLILLLGVMLKDIKTSLNTIQSSLKASTERSP